MTYRIRLDYYRICRYIFASRDGETPQQKRNVIIQLISVIVH